MVTTKPEEAAAAAAATAPEAEISFMVWQSRWTLNREAARKRGSSALLKALDETITSPFYSFYDEECAQQRGYRHVGSRQLYIALRNQQFESHPCTS